MNLALIQGTVSGLKLASDIAQSFLKLNTMTEVQGKVIDLQSAILSAQSSALAANSEQLAMVEQIRQLREEIAQVKAWEVEKQRYELKRLDVGVFAYSLKEMEGSAEPPHWICSSCFSNGKKYILQNLGDFYGASEYACHGCSSKIKVATSVSPEA